MYEPIKAFFTSMGYDVRAEVKNCDIVMVKEDEILIVEMKKSFNMALLFQLMERQKITEQVYAAIPNPRRSRSNSGRIYNGNFTKIKKICACLGIGLITVDCDSALKNIEIVCNPAVPAKTGESKRKQALRGKVIGEISGRTGDLNTGGVSKKPIVTAYRETVIRTACAMERAALDGREAVTARELLNEFNAPPNTAGILKRDFYGWFAKSEKKGAYELSDKGREMLGGGEYAELVEIYRNI
jgi:hypothetical protein